MYSEINVAIILPVYNAEKTIIRAIESVIEQTYTKWTLYIIDDFSTDETREIIKNRISDARIKYFRNAKNKGVSFSRNRGLDLIANEDAIAFIDSDDAWDINKLLLQVLSFRKGNKFIFTSYNFIKNEEVKRVSYNRTSINRESFLLKKFRVCFSSVLYENTEISKKIKFSVKGHEDFLFLNDMFSVFGEAYICSDYLVDYYVEDGSLSSDKLRAIKWQWELLLIIFEKNYFKSIVYFVSYACRGWLFNRRRG